MREDAIVIVHSSAVDRPSGPILDASEAAALLRVSTKTLLRLARAGQIPGKKVGREWRFSADALVLMIGAVEPR